MPITINGSTGVAGIDGSAGTPSVQGADTNTGVFFPAADTVALSTGGTERMRVDSSGSVSISGTVDPLLNLNNTGTGSNALWFSRSGTLHSAFYATSAGEFNVRNFQNQATLFWTNNTERMRITSGGRLLVNTTVDDPVGSNAVGTAIISGVVVTTADNQQVLYVNRKTSDGVIVSICQDGAQEGSISVSGTTVSYNSFAGSHWSQLSNNSRPDILTGTVVETIDEKCDWSGEDNDQLAKFKISDTVASKRVYGVFMSWDNDDKENNDAYITGLGAYLIRIAPGVTVEGGDLLESNGDGCARVQADDIIRSSTIAKVTCNIPTQTYDDGSYTVPCVLYCG